MVFRSTISNPGTTLIRAKKATAEWHIRHKLTTISATKPKSLSRQPEEDILDSMEEATRGFHQNKF